MIYLSGFIFPIENMPRVDSVDHDADPAAVFSGHRPRHLPEGRRLRRALAAVRPRSARWGDSGADAGGGPIEQARLSVAFGAMRIHVGTSGYNYPEWRGTFYPEDIKPRRCSPTTPSAFGRSRSTTRSTACRRRRRPRRGASRRREGFRYALKAPRRITHEQAAEGLRDDSCSSSASARACSGRTSGRCCFSCRRTSSATWRASRRFSRSARRDLRCAFEFRHDRG